MNERIQQLERRAFDSVWDLDTDPIGPGTHFRPDGFEEKFAELIVRECMRLNSKELSITAIERLLPLYRQHFGVEE